MLDHFVRGLFTGESHIEWNNRREKQARNNNRRKHLHSWSKSFNSYQCVRLLFHHPAQKENIQLLSACRIWEYLRNISFLLKASGRIFRWLKKVKLLDEVVIKHNRSASSIQKPEMSVNKLSISTHQKDAGSDGRGGYFESYSATSGCFNARKKPRALTWGAVRLTAIWYC